MTVGQPFFCFGLMGQGMKPLEKIEKTAKKNKKPGGVKVDRRYVEFEK